MLTLRLVLCRSRTIKHLDAKQIQIIRLIHAAYAPQPQPAPQFGPNKAQVIRSKVIYPKKHVNSTKSLSAAQRKLYRDAINHIQCYLKNENLSSDSEVDLTAVFGSSSPFGIPFDDKILNIHELQKWLHKMPNLEVTLKSADDKDTETQQVLISRDPHIECIDFVSNKYPMISWKNHLHFKTHFKRKRHPQNTVNHITDLISFYQLHAVFPSLSLESKTILSRGLNTELITAYNKVIQNRVDELSMNDYHHLLGNLGLNILSHFNQILCSESNMVMNLHSDLVSHRITSIDELRMKYNRNLDVDRYGVLCHFLIEYYRSYFVNRTEYENVVHSKTQKMSSLDVMPFLFEMKALVQIGKLLDFINSYHSRLLSSDRIYDGYSFDIHGAKRSNEMNKQKKNGDGGLFKKPYRVFSERQLENGDCAFSVERCTPDIVLSEPIWINSKPVWWFDAKCTKGSNCLYDTKRHYQMYRFTKNYGSGAILALGSADLSIVGINDVTILDCSHYL